MEMLSVFILGLGCGYLISTVEKGINNKEWQEGYEQGLDDAFEIWHSRE